MQKKITIDVSGATLSVGILFMGWLLMLTPLAVNARYVELMIWILCLSVLHSVVWYAIAHGSYIFIDTTKNIFRASRFCISKTIPLNSITNIRSQATFGGVVTEIQVWYTDKSGKQKMTRTVSKQAFKKGVLKGFLEALHLANPHIDIAPDLLDK